MRAEGGPPVSRTLCHCAPAALSFGLKARRLPFRRDPAGGPWEHPDTGVQQLLEEKEQALAILQETVKVR